MRDIALSLVFVGLMVLAFRHTWVGALVWTWFSLMNPHKLTYGFAFAFPFAAITAAVTLLSILWNRKKLRLPADPSVVLLILFLLWCCVTTLMAIHPDGSMDDLEKTSKIQLMTLVCIAALRARWQIEAFVWVNVASIGFYAVKGGIFAIATGGGSRVWGPPQGMVQGNNEIGLAIVMIIPLMNYLRVTAPQAWLRRSMLVAMVLSAVAVLATQSRGALVAIAAMGVVLWWRSNNKVLGLAVMACLTAALLSFMPDSWQERMATISTYQQDGSAIGRLNAWQTAINVANDRITGAGFEIERLDIFTRYAPDPSLVLTAHSIYFQALGEQGWIGLALFLAIGAVAFRTASKLRKQALAQPETRWVRELAGMIQVSMVGYGVGGAFLSLTYFDLPYNVLVMLVAAKYWMREERWRDEPTGLWGAGSGVREPKAKPGNAAAVRPA
jgi:probable O-glycosylation ligase (exosortase A-associated)